MFAEGHARRMLPAHPEIRRAHLEAARHDLVGEPELPIVLERARVDGERA
jgi:hypothetical protein